MQCFGELAIHGGQLLQSRCIPVPLELAFAVSGEARRIALVGQQHGEGRGQPGQQGGIAPPAPADMPEQPQVSEERKHLLGGQDDQFHAVRVLKGQLRAVEGLFMPGEQLLLQVHAGNIVVPVVDGIDQGIAVAG
ncbi:hypothetical protein D3C73_1182580 [compost metagenome]